MSLITPSIGLIIWQCLIFLALLFFLKKYVWKHIINIIEQREHKIRTSLEMVKDVEKKIIDLKIYQQNIIKNTNLERDAILQQAYNKKHEIEKENKKNLDIERAKMMKQIQLDIYNEKINAIKYLKEYISNLSISITEKILKQELNNKKKHQTVINQVLNEL